MADSTIRVRQLNAAELTGFVSGVINAYPKTTVTGSIIPSGSGVANLGSSSYPYSQIYVNQLNLPSGSGINFGPSFFRAYNSGGFAYVSVGGVTISSSGDSIYIAGPSGKQGPSGVQGPTGVSGVGVTGATYNTNSHILTFYYSNGGSNSFNFQGLSGDTGVSVTGFFQSGAVIYPQFDHYRGTGEGINLPAGPQGAPGSIHFYFEKSGSDVEPQGTNFPSVPTIDPYYVSERAPTISMMRGMIYDVDASGLHTHTITAQDLANFSLIFTGGQVPPWNENDQVNYYTSGNDTGYWRFSFFPSNTATGYYSQLGMGGQVFDEASNFEVYRDIGAPNLYRTSFSLMAGFTAQNHYKYGFMVYTIGGDTSLDVNLASISTGRAYVLGDVYFSSGVGPVGPIGPQGNPGIQGIPGVGIQGPSGDVGASVVNYVEKVVGPNQYQLQFIFSDGNIGPWIDMPSGGPSGVAGPSGAKGGLTNYFSGEYSPSTTYSQNDTVSNSGSSYVYVFGTPAAGQPVTNTTYWQMLAKAGDVGPTGATGVADRYSSSFLVVSGYPTGAGTFGVGITGLTVNGVNVSGTGSRFRINDAVAFRNSGLSGYSFTPYQQIVLSTNSYTGTYCYATVVSFDRNSGILAFSPSGGTGINNVTVSGGYFSWWNWNNATINLGANVMSGAQGIQGIQGIQGAPGAASAMRTQTYTISTGASLILNPTGVNITGGTGIDCFCVMITGNGIQPYGMQAATIDFNWSGVQTGQSLILKIRNSGIPYGNDNPPLFYFDGVGVINSSQIKWPMDTYTRPNDKEAYVYTILRFPDEGGLSCFGTYSNPYRYI
jgi:hypothetical protein